jgi:hypothetical protein
MLKLDTKWRRSVVPLLMQEKNALHKDSPNANSSSWRITVKKQFAVSSNPSMERRRKLDAARETKFVDLSRNVYANGLHSRRDAAENNVAMLPALENGRSEMDASMKVHQNARKLHSIIVIWIKPKLDVNKRLVAHTEERVTLFARLNVILMEKLVARLQRFTDVAPSRSVQTVKDVDVVCSVNMVTLRERFTADGFQPRSVVLQETNVLNLEFHQNVSELVVVHSKKENKFASSLLLQNALRKL